MSTPPLMSFGALLRRYRLAAGLSQEELAERAHLSREAIGTLERGNRRAPRKETIDLLAEALSLTEPERAVFEAAARQHKLLAPSPTPTDAQTESLETPDLPQDSPPLPSSSLPPDQVVQPSPPASSLAVRRKRGVVLGSSILVSVVLIGALFLAGELGGHASPRGGMLCLATDFPTSGKYAFNKSLENAVNLAVMQHQRLDNGYQLQVSNYDDVSPQTGDSAPPTGAHNVQQMVQNPCVVGMVGPYVSTVAAAEMPIAANAGLVMISPSSTAPGLTLRSYAALEGQNFDQLHPPGKPLNFFRIAPNDAAEGAVDADFTFHYLGARSVYVVSDRSSYGEEVADGFTQSFEVKSGRIVGIESIPNDGIPSVIAAVAERIAATNPDAVFYGGFTESGAGLLKAQLVTRGYTGPFVGGAGIGNDPGFVRQAGAEAARGTFATVAAFDLAFSPSVAAAQFLRDYHARHPGEEILPYYTVEAYDAAMVLITVIKQLIQAGQPVTRAAMLDQVQHIQYVGVTGPISFDKNGDTAHGVVTMYSVQAGQWVYFQQVNV